MYMSRDHRLISCQDFDLALGFDSSREASLFDMNQTYILRSFVF